MFYVLRVKNYTPKIDSINIKIRLNRYSKFVLNMFRSSKVGPAP